jgi:hypothetical protein
MGTRRSLVRKEFFDWRQFVRENLVWKSPCD